MRTYIKAVASIPLLFSGLLFATSDGTGWTRSEDATFPFTVEYPAGWYRLDPSGPPFSIVNFHPSKRVKAVVLPDRGAEIVVLTRPSSVRNLDQWIAKSRKGAKLTSERTFQLADAARQGREFRVIELQYNWTRPPRPFFESTDCYFNKQGVGFVARLTYWEGDPDKSEYRTTLHELVRRIEVRANSKKH